MLLFTCKDKWQPNAIHYRETLPYYGAPTKVTQKLIIPNLEISFFPLLGKVYKF